MKKKIIIHIGLHKTGSTSIQINCHKYRKQLLNAGIYYPKFTKEGWVNHSVPLSLLFMDRPLEKSHSVSRIFSGKNIAEEVQCMKAFFLEELVSNNSYDILLSGEDISILSYSELDNFFSFLEKLGDFDIKVFVYVRHPVYFCLSNAQEFVRSGLRTLSSVLGLGDLQQVKIKLTKFCNVFGDKNVNLFFFDHVIKQYGDINEHFFGKIGVQVAGLEFNRGNESMSLEKVLVLSSCITLGFGVEKISILNEKLPNKGTKIEPSQEIAEHIWSKCLDDVDFIEKKLGVVIKKEIYTKESVIDRTWLFNNLYQARDILFNNFKYNLDFIPVFQNIISDVEDYFPSIAVQVAVIAYNCSSDQSFRKKIDVYQEKRMLKGKEVQGLFMIEGEEFDEVDFDASNYILRNPDISSVRTKLFHHYYAFGRFLGFSFAPLPVIALRSDLSLEKGDMSLEYLKKDKKEVMATLQKDWFPKQIWIVDQKLVILTLVNKRTHGRGIWYFDKNGLFIGNNIESLYESGHFVVEAMGLLFARFVVESTTSNKDIVPVLLEQGGIVLDELDKYCVEFARTAVDMKIAVAAETTGYDLFKMSHVLSQDSYFYSKQPSIVVKYENIEYVAQHGVVVSDFVIAYCLYNISGGCIIVFEGGHVGMRFALLDINAKKLIVNRINPAANELFVRDFLRHLREVHKELRLYHTLPSKGRAVIMRSNHIGHRLWNDLSGLFRLRQTGFADKVSALIHFNPQEVGELWIPNAKLLRRMEDNTVTVTKQIELALEVYRRNLFPIRVGDRFISKQLAKEIADHCREQASPILPREKSELRVIFGLRFENRTWLNQLHGLVELSLYLAENHPNLTLIIDGHDKNNNEKIKSHGENSSTNIGTLEKKVVTMIQEAIHKNGFAQTVKVVDAVDLDLSTSMAWILSADIFIAPWGAGLAKYKWIANLPGVIFTSQINLSHRHDLMIYENPQIREAATKCIYVDHEYIVDKNSNLNQVKVASMDSRDDFIVDIDGIKLAIEKVLEEIGKK